MICVFPEIPDKQKAWDDLIKLTNDEDPYVRREAVSVLGSSLSHVPDKQKPYNDLIKLTNDEDLYVRKEAVSVLDSLFSRNLYIQPELEELHKLTNDEDSFVRYRGSIYPWFCHFIRCQINNWHGMTYIN